MRERPKVLLVGPFPPTIGGVTSFMLNLMSSPLSEDVDFMPFTTSRPPKRNLTSNWGYRSVLKGGMIRIAQGAAITLWHLLSFPFVAWKADVVQIQSSDYQVFWESSVYLLWGKLLRKPVLLRLGGGAFDRFHAASPAFARRLIERIIRMPHVLIAQSEYWREMFVRYGRSGPVLILPNWTSLAPVESGQRSSREPPTFLFIAGTEAVRKGIDEVLEAICRLRTHGVAVHCRMVAVPPVLRQRIEGMGLGDSVQMHGYLERAALFEVMRTADVFLLPSHLEGFPNSLIEAMALGLPSIVTPVGAIPEIVRDGGALMVPIGDPVALSDAIQRLIGDPGLRTKLGKEACGTVMRHYSPAAALPPLRRTYYALISPA